MKKILILVAALIAASMLAAIVRAGKEPGANIGDVYDESTTDFLGV